MRRTALSAATLLALGTGCLASDGDALKALARPGPNETPPGRRLYATLEAEANILFQARRAAVGKLHTPREIAARSAEIVAKIRASLGELPERTPLNPRASKPEKRDGYSIERVVYESRPAHHVTALFYLPEGDPPFPGVLFPCGHEANGKAGEAYQRLCVLMAKSGLAVLCYDPIGQGERMQLLDAVGKPVFSGSTSEHTAVGLGALLVGRSAAGYRVWDGIRGLDYLAGRPEVDPRRLGCTGNSGGGTLTSYLMALDDRIAVAAPSCFITSVERLLATIGPQDAEQNLVGQVAQGIEHADFITARAPKPTLLCVGTQDFFDIDGSWVTYQEVKRIYGKLGFGERVDLFESDEGHGFTRPRREAAVRWMRRWLLGKDEPTVEPEFPVLTDAEALCTKSGQVLTEFHGRSAFDLNAERAGELARARAGKRRDKAELLAEVRRLIALPVERTTPEVHSTEVGGSGDTLAMRHRIGREPNVMVTVTDLTSRTSSGKTEPVHLIVEGESKKGLAFGVTVLREDKGGQRLIYADLRGTGATTPDGPSSRGLGAFGFDWQESFLALDLNRPLLGQRVADLIAVLDALRLDKGVHLVGIGSAAPVVLHAAALDPRITSLTLQRPVLSWTAVASVPSQKGELANVIPGVLKVYDLPDLAATLAPRPLTLQSVLNPTGKPVAVQDVESAYAGCRQAYRAASADKAFVVEPGP